MATIRRSRSRPRDQVVGASTPVVLDPGVKYSAETSQTLREVMPESSTVSDDVETDDSEFDNDIDDVDDGEVDDESVSGSAGTR